MLSLQCADFMASACGVYAMPQGGAREWVQGEGAIHQQRGRATHIERLKSEAEAEQETCPSGGNATWPGQAWRDPWRACQVVQVLDRDR